MQCHSKVLAGRPDCL